jgi:hypothetical protein
MAAHAVTAASLQIEELDQLDAPSWDSFYQGLIAGITVVAVTVSIAT